jgi:L-ribulose-5-phosphate 3-epimerase
MPTRPLKNNHSAQNQTMMERRIFLKATAAGMATAVVGSQRLGFAQEPHREDSQMFDISLAQWSLHRMLQAGELDNLDFPKFCKEKFDLRAVEYVNRFFNGKAKDAAYLADLRDRCESEGVASLLIMVDGEGALGDADETNRATAVENHFQWIEAAKTLGCHSIRVNAQSSGSFEEQQARAADGLQRLAVFAADHDMNVIVENHGGLSSNGAWLAGVIKMVDLPNCGTLPDFGNFNIGDGKTYDRYLGVKELMPYAKAVSAKSHEFSDTGDEIHTNYRKMMQIVIDAGYHGYVGIEYEGEKHDEVEGVKLTKALLERVREEMS